LAAVTSLWYIRVADLRLVRASALDAGSMVRF